jgi:hypothetical protein
MDVHKIMVDVSKAAAASRMYCVRIPVVLLLWGRESLIGLMPYNEITFPSSK